MVYHYEGGSKVIRIVFLRQRSFFSQLSPVPLELSPVFLQVSLVFLQLSPVFPELPPPLVQCRLFSH